MNLSGNRIGGSKIKILITGANGLLGQKLVSLLEKDASIHVIATAHRQPSIRSQKADFHLLNITDKSQVELILHSTRPDVVIHTAAMTNVDQCETDREGCWLTNVTAVQYLVNACSQNNIHFIQLSTDFIFDGTYGPLDELAIPNPVNFYGESKLEAERIIHQTTLSWCIIRTVLVYGVTTDMSRSNIVLWVKNSLEEGKEIQVVNDQWRTPTLAEDLAMGCSLAALKKASGIFHISGKDFLTPYEMAIQVSEFFSLDQSLITMTDSTQFKQTAQRPLKTGFIIEKAKAVLGYAPRSFTEGLAVINSQLTKN